jgi:CDP-4-dehydro-6-deoxyglucose reductase, E1
MSDCVINFEKEFAKYIGSKYCVMVNSGSSANLLMIAALFFVKKNKLKAGDEVIVPSVSWSTTYAPLQQYGLHVKFVDIDYGTLNFDLDQLKNAITTKTKLIFAVNLLGNPNDYGAIKSIIKNIDIKLIEDNCESLGALLDGKQAGSFGLMGSFSSYYSHHIVTMEGGMVVTDDEELYHILLCLRSHGWTRHLPQENKICVKSDNDFEEHFRFIMPGYNVRPIEMMGAIGLEQIKKLDGLIVTRRKNAEIFQDMFTDHKYFDIQKEIGQSSWFGFSLILKDNCSIDRNDVIKLLKENNIDTRPIVAGNIADKEMIKEYFDYSIFGKNENAQKIDQRGFYVGNHPSCIKKEVEYLRMILNKI